MSKRILVLGPTGSSTLPIISKRSKALIGLVFLSNFRYFYVVCAVCIWYNV